MLSNKSTDRSVPFVLPEWIVKDHEHIQDFRKTYHIHNTVELRFDIRDSRVVFTVMDKGVMVDAVGRLYKSTKAHASKWKRYGDSRRAYVCGTGHTAIVVEDCISAAQALEFQSCTGFAIMGTALLREHIEQLQDYAQVIVALDPDAMTKTVAYTRQLKSSGIDAHALKLYDDLKYRQPQDMQRVHSLIERFNGTCLTQESVR
jgi:hypothetical protein